jgi:hypothetical protein
MEHARASHEALVGWISRSPASATVSVATRSRGPGHGELMKGTQMLHDAGQSIWLDTVTRELKTASPLPSERQ